MEPSYETDIANLTRTEAEELRNRIAWTYQYLVLLIHSVDRLTPGRIGMDIRAVKSGLETIYLDLDATIRRTDWT
jgi:hypothetical protein